jgi:hypothetical protein
MRERCWKTAEGDYAILIDPWDEDHVETFLLGLGKNIGARVVHVAGEHRLIIPAAFEDEATIARMAFS